VTANSSTNALKRVAGEHSREPEDYIYIIQPPTYESWGVGIAFYYYGGTVKITSISQTIIHTINFSGTSRLFWWRRHYTRI